jgi:hypothetical protein
MMVDMIWQLPRIREETDKIDLIALEAPDKLSTATIEATIKSQKAQRVSAALAGIGQSAARKCDFSAMSQCVATSNSCAYGAVCCQANE